VRDLVPQQGALVIGGALRWAAEAARRAVAAAYAAPHEEAHPENHAPPFLVVDLYWRDLDGRPDWNALATATWRDSHLMSRPYHGAILKATEGTSYYPGAIDWFKYNWPRVRRAAGPSYGVDFVRGAYHYLRFGVDGERQADYYLRTIDQAGGWGHGDVLPIVDIEYGGPTSSNRKVARAEVERNARAFVAKVRAATGRGVILYGGSALAEIGIKERLGCSWLWPAAYTARMSSREATSIGWTVPEIAMWQYTDGKTCKAVTTKGTRLPRVVPGFGAVDCSVFTGGATIADFMHVLCGDGRDHP
jgi:GH25 family lysozyme M1 (1,4-beta-N-acetylmuramidase)